MLPKGKQKLLLFHSKGSLLFIEQYSLLNTTSTILLDR